MVVPDERWARIVLAETSDVVRLGVKSLIADDPDLAVVDETTWPQELPQICQRRSPDLVVLGVPDESQELRDVALEAMRRCRHDSTHSPTIALIGREPADVLAAAQAGARGILPRDCSGERLLKAIHDVLGGACALDPSYTCYLFEFLCDEDAPEVSLNAGNSVKGLLSGREIEVLRALAEGLRGSDLTVRLGITRGTVKSHVRHILSKLNVPDRMSAVLKAQRDGLLDDA